MKKATIARFVIGGAAIFAAFGLAGCGAETGAPEAEGVGQASEALTSVGALGSTFNMPAGLQHPASCVLTDFSGTPKDLIIQIGGFTITPAAVADIRVFDPSIAAPASAWSTALLTGTTTPLTLTDARGRIKAIRDPNDVHSCILVGGTTTINGNAFNASAGHPNVQKLTIDNTSKFTLTTLAALPRTNFELKSCGKSVIAFGGIDNGGNALDTVEYMDTSAGTPAWNLAGTLSVKHYDFGITQDGSKFVVAGGNTGLARTKVVDLIQATNANCTTWSSMGSGSFSSLPNGIEGNAVVRDPSTANRYIVTAGKDSAAPALTASERFDINWAVNPPVVSAQAASTALSAATYLPIVVQNPSAVDYVIGGLNASSATFTTNAVEEAKATLWQLGSLPTSGRVSATAEVLGGKIYLFGGKETVGPSLPVPVVLITP